MSYDLEVLVVNQENPVTIPFFSSIEVLDEIDDKMVLRLDETWKFMSKTKGIWYSLIKQDKEVQNAFSLCKSDFKVEPEKLPIPFWINNENVIYHLTPLIINKEYIVEFEKILEFLVNQFPSNTIMFLPRYQGGDYEIIQGSLSLSEFINQLNN
jgi:hypothetical protein